MFILLDLRILQKSICGSIDGPSVGMLGLSSQLETSRKLIGLVLLLQVQNIPDRRMRDLESALFLPFEGVAPSL